LSDSAAPNATLLPVPQRRPDRLTHYLFRYPAKFHPPVVSALLDRYTRPGDLVLDPFVGSGTALVEASVLGRRSVGVDVDPVAVEVSRAKTRRYDVAKAHRASKKLLDQLLPFERNESDYAELMFEDISDEAMNECLAHEGLWIPAIPRLGHWFRRYVTVDLARIVHAIDATRMDAKSRLLLRIVLASIIRNASNADPVPVSGLEYTSHMRRRDEEGRLVNVYALFRGALQKALAAIEEYARSVVVDLPEPVVLCGDATRLPHQLPTEVDAVLTSPPYHNAVDYYRRHQLEVFWLGLTASQADRHRLLPQYIGRPRVAQTTPLLQLPWQPGPLAAHWETRIREVSSTRANDFRHYSQAMALSFAQLAKIVRAGSPVILVVGHSTWNGYELPTADLLQELAGQFELSELFYYPIKNRYMSYTRHNQASIEKEYVLVFKRR